MWQAKRREKKKLRKRKPFEGKRKGRNGFQGRLFYVLATAKNKKKSPGVREKERKKVARGAISLESPSAIAPGLGGGGKLKALRPHQGNGGGKKGDSREPVLPNPFVGSRDPGTQKKKKRF